MKDPNPRIWELSSHIYVNLLALRGRFDSRVERRGPRPVQPREPENGPGPKSGIRRHLHHHGPHIRPGRFA